MSKVEVFAQSKEEFVSSVDLGANPVCDKTVKQYLTLARRIIERITYDNLMRFGAEKEVIFAAIDDYIVHSRCKNNYRLSSTLNENEVNAFMAIYERHLLHWTRVRWFTSHVYSGHYDVKKNQAPREPILPSVLQSPVDIKNLSNEEIEDIIRQKTEYNVEMVHYETAVENFREQCEENSRKFWEIIEFLGNYLEQSNEYTLPTSVIKVIIKQVKEEEHQTRKQDLEDLQKQIAFVKKCFVSA